MHNIKDLKIWNKSMDLAIRVYDLSAKFPADERYGLISQIRRCAVSIPSNISEGAGRNSNKELNVSSYFKCESSKIKEWSCKASKLEKRR